MDYFFQILFTDFFHTSFNSNFPTGYHKLQMQENKRNYITSTYGTSRKVINHQGYNDAINNSGEYKQASYSYNQPNQHIKVTTTRTASNGGTLNQTSSKYIINSSRTIQNGQSHRSGGDFNGSIRHNVQFENQDKLIISGQTQFATLKHTKDLLLSLLNEFNSNNRVVFQGDQKQDFSKRLLMLEHELQGTMRRGIYLNSNDPSGNQRTLDYSRLLNQKQNQLCDKDRKIGNYEQKLRIQAQRVLKMQLQIETLTNLVAQKNAQIGQLRRQLELRSSALDKIKSQPNISNSNEVRQILRFLKIQEEGQAQNNGIRSHLSQIQRELNKLKSKEFSLIDLQNSLETIILALPRDSILKNKLQCGQLRRRQDQAIKNIQQKFAIAANLYRNQIQFLSRQNPGLNINVDTQILELLRSPKTRVNVNINGVIQIQKQVKVTKQVPVQDARTKFLINALLLHVRKINDKYPKLKGQMDVKLQQFLNDEMLDAIQVDSLDNIIDIVRYVPQMVKVQNVYTYSSQKNRKAQFHLRVLIKALLEQMQKVKREKGIVFQIDQGVIGMIRAEIMDLVDVDDILKIYRPVPKIVQVPKIIEKIVDNIVRVPQKYITNQLNTQAIGLQKPMMAVDEKALIVQSFQPIPLYREKPVEMMSHTSKVVSHPQLNERVAIEVREKTKLQPEERVVEKIVEVQKPVFIQKDKIVIQKELQPVEVIKQVVRYLQTQKEVVKEIEVVVEKIVEKVVQKEKIVRVPQIIEKIVQVVKYQKVPQIIPHIQTRVQVVKEYIEKIVPVVEVQEKLIYVPQIAEKIVTVQKIIERPPRQIEVIKQVIKIVKEIQIVEVQVPKIIYQTRVQVKQVQKFIQVPVIVPQTKIETQIHQVPFIETVQIEKHIPVQVVKHVIMTEEKPVQVIKNVPFIMKEEVPVLVKEQRVVNQQIYFEKIKQIPTVKQKIIQKIVQVPKVVEIQKIVQKIVVVPRIIEKIVQVPQIVQKIVEKIVQIPIQMPPEVHYIPHYMNVQKPVEIETQKIVYITVDRPVQVPSDQIMVKDIETRTQVQVQQVYKQRVVIQRQQVPVQMHVDKIITVPYQKKQVEIVQKVIYQPIQCPVPVYLQKTVPVYINTETVHVQPVTQIVEKIIQKNNIKREPQIIPQIKEKVIVERKTEFKQVQKVYIEKQIQQVDRYQQKIVAINTTIDQIKQVPYYIQKLVPVIQEIPKIFQFQKEPKVVFTPPTIQIVQKIVPKIINVNKYIQKLVEKLIQVPHLLKEVEIIKERHEKNIPGPQKVSTNLKTVNLEVEKELIRQKEKIIQTRVNCLEQTLKVMTQVMQRQRDPVIITQDRIIQIPIVMEKICEKIVVMPQIVEVLKYVHELIDNDVNMSIDVDITVQAQEYKRIGQDLQKGFGQFLAELNKLKSLQPSAAARITLIEQYLAKFRRFIKYPKIHEIIREKVVEKQKDKIVKIPMQKTQSEVRQQLAKVLLIQKLISEISRIKRTHPQINLELQDDINFIFRLNFDGKVRDINNKLTSQLKQFQHSLDKKFSKMGGWTKNHQLMLKSFLEERFVLANIVKSANQEIKTVKKVNQDLAADNLRMRAILDQTVSVLIENKNMMPSIMSSLSRENQSLTMGFSILIKRFDELIDKHNHIQKDSFEPTRYLGKRFIEDLMGSVLRQKEKEIQLLRQKLRTGKYRQNINAESSIIIKNLQYQVSNLTNKLNQMGQSQLNNKNTHALEAQIERLNKIIREKSSTKSIQVRNLQTQISRLKLVIQQGNNHNQCTSIQRGLQLQNNRLKKQIESLLLKLQMAQREIALLKQKERQYQSPKRTIGTSGSISPRQRQQGRRSIVISHVERASQAQEYGENYQQYMLGGNINIGMVDNGSIQGYHSGITMEGKDLANSAATYRSGHTGHTITSSHYIRPNINHNVTQSGESARMINQREGTQYSMNGNGTVGGTSGVKKYSYYQKRYEEK